MTSPSARVDVPSGDAMLPLSMERVIAVCEAEGWRFECDEDGDPIAFWDNISICFSLLEDSPGSLNTSAFLLTWFPSSLDEAAQAFITDYEKTNDWPELWVDYCGDGESMVISNVVLDLPEYLSQSELAEHMRRMVARNRDVFAQLCAEIDWLPAQMPMK